MDLGNRNLGVSEIGPEWRQKQKEQKEIVSTTAVGRRKLDAYVIQAEAEDIR